MAKDTTKLADDFEEFDFDFGDDDFGSMFNEPPPATGRDAVAQTLKNAGANFASEFNVSNIDNISKMLEKTIPYKLQSDVSNMVELKDSLLKEVEAYGPSIKSSTNKLTKMMAKFLPKEGMMANALNKLDVATADESSYGRSEPSKEEALTSKISDMLSEAVGEKSKKEYFEEKIKESINYRKDLNTLQIQNHMAANLERLSAFNVDIASGYYRKSLELQYRQLDTQLETLSVSKAASDTFKNQLEAIVKNTALPDAIKMRSTEMIAMLAKNKSIDSGLNTFFGEGTKFDKMKKRATERVKGIAQNLEETLSEAAGYGELYETMREAAAMNGGGGGMVGSMAADMVQTILGEKLGNKLAKTKTGNKIFSKFQSIMQDPSEYAKEKIDASYASEKNDTFTEKLKRAIFGNIRDVTRNDMTENTLAYGKANMSESAIMDNRFYSTVTKDIPTILTGILQESASIFKILSNKLGDDSRADKMIYDRDTDTLITESETKDKISAKLDNNIRKGGSSYYVKRAVDTIIEDTGFKFSGKERAQIESAIMEYSMNGGSVSAKLFKDVKFLGMLKDKKLIKRVMRLNDKFSTQHDDLEVGSRRGEFGSNLNRALTSIQNPKDIITEYDAQGNSKILEELGIITVDKMTGRITINNKKYKEMIKDSIYNESLASSSKQERERKPVNKETQELFDSVDINKTTQDLKDQFNNSKVGQGINKAKDRVMENETVKKAVKAKDDLVNEFTGENLDKNLEKLGNEFTVESAKKRANQAYDFAVKETSEESIAKRKEQAKNLYNDAVEMTEELKQEFTKDNLIAKEKKARKYIKETLTKENIEKSIASVKLALKDSGLEEELNKQLGESTVAKLVNDAITTTTKLGKDITEAELTKNILREVGNASKDIRESKTFKDIVEEFEEVKNDVTLKADTFVNETTINGKSIKDHAIDEKLSFRNKANGFFSSIFKIHPKEENIFDSTNNPINENEEKENKEEVTIVEKLSDLIEALKGNKETIEKNTEEVAKNTEDGNGDKSKFNDLNKDGKRDGSFMDKLAKFTRFKKDKAEATVAKSTEKKDDKKETSLMSIIMMLIPFAGTVKSLISGAAGLLTGIGTFTRAVFSLVSGLSSAIGFLGNGLIKPILGKVLDIVPGLVKMGLNMTTGALGLGKKGLDKFLDVAKVGRSVEGKMLGGVTKSLGKRALSKVPGLGVAAGAYLGYDYLQNGDTTGAIGTWASTLLAQIPVIGTGASLGVDAWLMSRDLDKEAQETKDGMSEEELAAQEDETRRKEEEAKARQEWADNQDKIQEKIDALEGKVSEKENVFEKLDAEKEEAIKEKEKIEKESDNRVKTEEEKAKEKEKALAKLVDGNTRVGSKFDKLDDSKPDSSTSNMDSAGNEEMSEERKAMLADIDAQRQRLKEKTAAANGTKVASNGKSFTAYNSFAGTGSGEDRFAEGTEPQTYKDITGASKDEIKKIIVDNSKKAGMNPSIMLTMAAKESSMNPNAKAPTSSATGLYQFLNGTWKDVVNTYGGKYGLNTSNANRLNPEHSTLMAAEYLKQNLAPIKKVKGGINATDAYLTHFLGPGGARKFLSSNPSASSEMVVGAPAVNANKGIFAPNGTILSVGDAYKVIAKQLKKVSDQFGISGIVENTFNSAGGISNPTDGLAGGQVNANAKEEDVVVAKDNPFDNIDNTSKVDPMGNKKDGSGNVNTAKTIVQDSPKNTVTPNNNYYNSGAAENKPTNVESVKSFTDKTNMGVSDAGIKNTVSQSVELSIKNVDELKSIAASAATIAANTGETNKILNSVAKLLEANNAKVLEYIEKSKTATVSSADGKSVPGTQNAAQEVISTKRGESILETWNRNNTNVM